MRKPESGFTMIEVVVVAAVTMIMVGLAAPSITGAMQTYRFNSDVQSVATVIRNARHKAVAANVTMRVRLNCPAVGQMRMVEVTGNAAIDTAIDRCDEAAYPYPAPDSNLATLPNNDGPVVAMGPTVNFAAAVPSIQISTTGRMVPLTGCPNCAVGAPPFQVWVTDDYTATRRSMTVTTSGAVTVSRFATAP
jgi:Tfp pilus assembly protein FimT